MKNLKFISFLMLIASSLIFVQCTHESVPGPQGVAGIDGINGINGIDGKDGKDGAASCTECHSDSHRLPIESSYPYSAHANQTIMYNGMTLAEYANQSFFGGSCTQCHTNEGYIDYMNTGATNPGSYANPTRIDCKTCHDKHGTFDFENDGYDFALRNFAPTTLITDPTYTIDFGDKSNNCASCHQPRTAPPVDDGTGMFAVTSSRWGPHHGPQSTLLEGIQGAEIAGSEAYPGIGTATHRTGSSCTNCHMGADSGADDGEHTFKPTSTACTTCHPGGAPGEVDGLAANMTNLAALLEGIGIVHDGHPVEGDYTISQAEAAWNYLLIIEDSSNGVHNPAYAKALIKNSIEVLN